MGKAAQWTLWANTGLCDSLFGAANAKKEPNLDVGVFWRANRCTC